MDPPLVLASASPRRAALLAQLGLSFEVLRTDVDEDGVGRGLKPRALAAARAVAKAEAGLALRPAALVLGADTLVVAGRRILGKPRDEAEALEMLGMLSGRSHTVWTAVALLRRGDRAVAVEYARVMFRPLDAEEMRGYASLPEARDKAGAYAIQGRAAGFVRRIEGEYTTIVGLPLGRLSVMLRRLTAGREG